MAKRKKTKKTSKRRGGMRGLRSGNMGKKIGMLVTTILTANAVDEGLVFLKDQDFMQQSADSKSKLNIKQAGASGALMLLGGFGSIAVENEYLNAAANSVVAVASVHLKDDVKPAMGLGAVEDFLDLYRSEEPLEDLNGPGEVDLAGDELDIA